MPVAERRADSYARKVRKNEKRGDHYYLGLSGKTGCVRARASCRVKRISLLAILLIGMAGCGGEDSAAVPPANLPPNMISPGGGTVSSPGVASVSAPASAFSANATVDISQAAAPSADPDFSEMAELLSAGTINSTSVVVAVSQQPSQTLRVSLTAGPGYIANRPPGQKVRVLAATENEADEEDSYATWDSIDATIDESSSTVSFDAEPSHFSRPGPGGARQGVFILVLTPAR
jgi:hypothetical protein